jgi:hypothetical protein
MIEGVAHDDQYRMVEDEFRAVAGDFTRHLHAAEYQRLKGLAKSRNSETIENISRPVTGEMTDIVKRRHAALDTASKQRQGIAKTLGKRAGRNESDEEASARRPATSLQGLMDSPRKPTVPLTSLAGSRPGSNYRSAADTSPSRRRPSGQAARTMVRNSSMDVSNRASVVPSKRPPTRIEQGTTSDSDDDDDDDLDGLPSWSRKPASGLPRPETIEKTTVQRAPPASNPPSRATTESSNVRNPFLRTGTARLQDLAHETSTREQAAAPKNEDEDDDFFARMRARRAEQRRRRETKAQDSNSKTSETNAAAISSIPFM